MAIKRLVSVLLGEYLFYAVMRWRTFEYRIGLRRGMLHWPWPRPEAPYRAIVWGLDQMYWPAFDAAYPEYEKAFAPIDVHRAELRNQLRDSKVALIVFEGVSQSWINGVTDGRRAVVFYASASLIPQLERNGKRAAGFLLDTVGPWQTSIFETEVSLFLRLLDLEAQACLVDQASAMLARSPRPEPGKGRLILPATGAVNTGKAAEDPAHPETTIFGGQMTAPWFTPQTIDRFLAALDGVAEVDTQDHPLGLLAALLGLQVTVRGNPVWAGYGLTNDTRRTLKHRHLTPAEFLAVVALEMSRYVDTDHRLVDPTEGWHLPSALSKSAAPSI